MKKIATLMFAVVCTTATMAQGMEKAPLKRHEINVGMGLLSHTQVATFMVDVVGTILTVGYGMAPDRYYILTPNLSYRYWFANWYALGAGYAFDRNSVKVRRQSDGTYMNTYKRRYSTFVLENTFGYIRKPKFQLYGQLGMGATFVSIPGYKEYDKEYDIEYEIERIPLFNLQVTPLGIRIGGDYAGFIEFGYGYKGVINAGFSVRL